MTSVLAAPTAEERAEALFGSDSEDNADVETPQLPPATAPDNSKRGAWSTEDTQRLVEMRRQGKSWADIRTALNRRTESSCYSKYYTMQRPARTAAADDKGKGPAASTTKKTKKRPRNTRVSLGDITNLADTMTLFSSNLETMRKEVAAAEKQQTQAVLQTMQTTIDELHDTVKRQRVQIRQAEIRYTCSVCLTNDVDTVLMGCKHLCLCHECADRITDCPLCRQPVWEDEIVKDLKF